MKWPYSVKNKLSASILLTIIILLILLVNIQNRQRFEQLDDSISSIYEDRLMAQNYLFRLYDNLSKEEIVRRENVEYPDQSLLDLRAERKTVISEYQKTYLTENEKKEFDTFVKHLDKIEVLEQQLLALNDSSKKAAIANQLKIEAIDAINSMRNLSNIQTKEGKALQISSHQIVLGSVSISQLELAILIVLALVIQVLIFTSKSLTIKLQTPHNLN